uniref:Uncharacterized protein n=1 Tax=Arundo donax TaxID=35708 RepID=A0A0A9ATI0_ARUDO
MGCTPWNQPALHAVASKGDPKSSIVHPRGPRRNRPNWPSGESHTHAPHPPSSPAARAAGSSPGSSSSLLPTRSCCHRDSTRDSVHMSRRSEQPPGPHGGWP